MDLWVSSGVPCSVWVFFGGCFGFRARAGRFRGFRGLGVEGAGSCRLWNLS